MFAMKVYIFLSIAYVEKIANMDLLANHGCLHVHVDVG